MKINIIKVPTSETFYFCREFMFHLAGSEAATFITKFNDKGYTSYPYNPEKNESILFITITSENKSEMIKLINNSGEDAYKYIVIFTDQNNLGFEVDELIDLTNLRDYYNLQLDLDKLYRMIIS